MQIDDFGTWPGGGFLSSLTAFCHANLFVGQTSCTRESVQPENGTQDWHLLHTLCGVSKNQRLTSNGGVQCPSDEP